MGIDHHHPHSNNQLTDVVVFTFVTDQLVLLMDFYNKIIIWKLSIVAQSFLIQISKKSFRLTKSIITLLTSLGIESQCGIVIPNIMSN